MIRSQDGGQVEVGTDGEDRVEQLAEAARPANSLIDTIVRQRRGTGPTVTFGPGAGQGGLGLRATAPPGNGTT